MIGQHIYSRCLEGYFSKSGLNADSTTVTISIDMFAREEQAKRIARECEKISTLEDVRAVPEKVQGAYRGVLKIRRINRQLTVVCRSYRLHSEQEQTGAFTGGGESRDFTYGSSYILSGEDKDRFLENPEYCLNIQDFEPYPSVMKRIQESRTNGHNGKIEANENYSLFHSQCRDAGPNVFRQAGFTKELFVDYISSIIQRVSYSHYSGHEKDKVLVILPKQFNVPWEKSGGNGYAEEVLAATMKILPECVRGQLSATTGGMHDPAAFVLEGYQLVFMENGSTRDWRKSEFSVIDLDRQESFVTNGLDTTYGEFLWNCLFEKETREHFENQYTALFGKEKIMEGDNSPEKFSFVLHLLQEEKQNFQNGQFRSRLLVELMDFCGDFWTQRAAQTALHALTQEAADPGYDKGLEEGIRELVQKEFCPEELKNSITGCIMQNILHGTAEDQSIHWICQGIQHQDPTVLKIVMKANHFVFSHAEIQWYDRKSLLDFYFQICKNPEIYADTKVKREILSILSDWYISFLEKNDWEKCVMITQILSEQLEDPRLGTEGRMEIYQDLIYLLFFGEGDGRRQIVDILKKEERKFSSNPQNVKLFWKCFSNQMREEDIAINDDVIWQMTYLAVSQDENFLRNEWEPLYRYMVVKFGYRYSQAIFETTREYFFNWSKNIQDNQKLRLLCQAIAISEMDNLGYGQPYYHQKMDDLRRIMNILEEHGMVRTAAMLLYKRYQTEHDTEKRKYFFEEELNKTEQWKLLLIQVLNNADNTFLNNVLPKLYGTRKEFLRVIADFEWEDKKETEKAAKIYFHLLQYYVRDNYSNEDPLRVWCRLCRKEMEDIIDASQSTEFASHMKRYFRIKMAKQNPLSVQNLDMEDVVFLNESGILPLGEGWEFLDIVSEIYMADPQCVSEEFIAVREKITGQNNDDLKQIYLDALEKKRTILLEANARGELIYNIALLEMQLNQELLGNDEYSVDDVARRVFGKAGDSENILTALHLLYVIRCYGFAADHEVYDCEILQKGLIREIVLTAKRTPELFESKQILKAYRQLSREDKAALEQTGFNQYLRELPGEWQNEYGVREKKTKTQTVVPFVVSGIVLLLGIGVELLFFFLYDSIGLQITVVTGILLAAIGAVGAVSMLIWVLVSAKRTKVSVDMRRKQDELS